jgi:pilus assembly protein Flp/PilA
VTSAAGRRRRADRLVPARGSRRKWRQMRALASQGAIRESQTARPLRLGRLRRGKRRALNQNAAPPHNAPHCGRCIHPKGDVMQLVNFVKSFARNDEGQDLLEYALLVALIALVAIAAVTAAGGSVKTIFQSIADKLTPAA